MATIIQPESGSLATRAPEDHQPSVVGNEADGDLVDDDGKPVEVAGAAMYEISFNVNGKQLTKPIHENLALASAINAQKFNSDGQWTGLILILLSLEQFEMIRGVFWNDDPNCQLFGDDVNGNKLLDKLSAVQYVADFEAAGHGGLDHHNLLYRSHYGDLQFVHAMAAAAGEAPLETQRKIKVWLQSMYAVYSGQNGVTSDTLVKSTAISEFFNDDNGHSSTTFRSLLMGRTPSFDSPVIGLRALGSCLHLIQDSCAKGHTHRDGDNGYGAILNFHCYDGQNRTSHSHWDEQGGAELDPGDLSSFDGIFGGRAAIDRSVRFLDLVIAKQAWGADLDAWFLDAFAVSPNATTADTSV